MTELLTRILRLVLFPFSLLYGLAVLARNKLYDTGLLRSYVSAVPVISVGNITVGGTGKSPVTARLAGLLAENRRVAVLSRGYGRSTKGLLEVHTGSSAREVGDEPLQLKKKMPGLTVMVSEDRASAIRVLEENHDVILLDDAFQHRRVTAGLHILLFDYASLGKFQWLLPTGNLREPLSASRRAEVLLVTKAPQLMSEAERERALYFLKPLPGQQVFFSYLEYDRLVALNGSQRLELATLSADEEIVVLTGIANPAPLISELKKYTSHIAHYKFPDHHTFTKENMSKLALNSAGKKIITTEKDAQRILSEELTPFRLGMDIYYLPIRAAIPAEDEERFTTTIYNYVHSKNS